MAEPFLTYDQQIDKLVNEKNLIVADRAAAISTLENIGYFALIDGYKWPLRNPMTRKYEDGTRFEDVVALYRFDDDLRVLLSGCLWRVERKLRNAVAHSFCERFGTDQAAYLDVSSYSSRKSSQKDVRKLLGILEYHANADAKHDYLAHQRARHAVDVGRSARCTDPKLEHNVRTGVRSTWGTDHTKGEMCRMLWCEM